uniref:Expressed conserved protein n=1 Tax=Echinococcus granulosus TaxID=6210 RepID=U6FTE2_ECHGR|nr:hypothetical protein EgrG_002067700 [Echinococcus granulosus]
MGRNRAGIHPRISISTDAITPPTSTQLQLQLLPMPTSQLLSHPNLLLIIHLPPLAARAVLVLAFSILLLICFIHYFLMPSTRHTHTHVMHSIGEEFGFGAAPSDEEDEREGDKDGEAALILPPI